MGIISTHRRDGHHELVTQKENKSWIVVSLYITIIAMKNLYMKTL